jgi:hypothetical protein
MSTQQLLWISLAVFATGCGSTLQPAESAVTRSEVEPTVEATDGSTTVASAGSYAGPPGEMEVTFKEAAPPPPAADPTPRKGFVTPPTAKKRAGLFAIPSKDAK